MPSTYIPATVASFSILHAAFPSKGAALLALPAETRVFCRAESAWVQRSANGTFWDFPDLGDPVPKQATGWYGPQKVIATTTATNWSAGNVRALLYKLQGNTAATLNRLSLRSNGAAVTPGGTDAMDIRLYLVDPLLRPMALAPVYVWRYTAAGGAGFGTFSFTGVAAGVQSNAFAFPDALTPEVPCAFMLAMNHGYSAATLPALYVPQLGSGEHDAFPESESAGVPTASAFDKQAGWVWTEAFVQGATTVFDVAAARSNIAPATNYEFA